MATDDRYKRAAEHAFAAWLEWVKRKPGPTDYCAANTIEAWVRALEVDLSLIHEKCDGNVMVDEGMASVGLPSYSAYEKAGTMTDQVADDLREDEALHEAFNRTFNLLAEVAREWLATNTKGGVK